MTMCLPCAMAPSAWRMPAGGTPVASTITSICGQAISAGASSVTQVRPDLSASSSEAAENRACSQPAVANWLRARATSKSATATTCRPRVNRACARNMVPNLPAPIRPTVTGRPAASRSSSMVWRFTGASRVLARGKPLLADGAGDENLGRAFGIVGGTAFEQELGRTFLLGLRVEASAALESLAAAERDRRRWAVGRAVAGRRTALASRQGAGIRQSDDGAGRLLRGVTRLAAELVDVFLSALHVRFELACALFQPAAKGVDEAGPEGRIGIVRNLTGGGTRKRRLRLTLRLERSLDGSLTRNL